MHLKIHIVLYLKIRTLSKTLISLHYNSKCTFYLRRSLQTSWNPIPPHPRLSINCTQGNTLIIPQYISPTVRMIKLAVTTTQIPMALLPIKIETQVIMALLLFVSFVISVPMPLASASVLSISFRIQFLHLCSVTLHDQWQLQVSCWLHCQLSCYQWSQPPLYAQ